MNESNQQNTGNADNEIDLFDVITRVWNACKDALIGLKNLLVFIIIYLIRKSLWMISFGLAGLLVGFLLYNVSRPFYTSSLEGTTGGIYDPAGRNYAGGIDNSVVIDHINKLNKQTGKPALLASNLGISTDDAALIRSINAYYGIDVNRDMRPDFVDDAKIYNPRDSTQARVPSFVHVRVTVYSEDVLPTLRRGLFQYISNNAYIQQLFKVDKDQKRELLAELDREIAKIDSMQRARLRREQKTEQGQLVFLGSEPEVKLFYHDILALHSRKQALQKDLDISDELIVVVQDFTPLEQEEYPLLLQMFFFGCLMAAIGLIAAILWQHRKSIWALIREDSTK